MVPYSGLGSHEAVSEGRRGTHSFSFPAEPGLQEQISYHDTLINFPFKGDEMALRNMEHAELITITTHDGRPSTIKPGKPVYRCVFERVAGGPFILPLV